MIPVAIAILIGLFSIQKYGSGRVGKFFGPVTFVWFLTLAVLGTRAIVRSPDVLYAFGPHHAIAFFVSHGWSGFKILGSVFLVVTGGEALYADLGHFGRPPIRRAWFSVVLPALVLNYLGQGALMLHDPEAKVNPFFHLAPRWALYPLVALSTAACIIASQALITGAFSMTWQAIQLGYLPRFHVQHTSREEMGQIFLPGLNNALMVGTVALVVGFESSSNLAAAYGIAVTTTMLITSLLAFVVMRELWKWSLLPALALTMAFLVLDISFLGANVLKVFDGGWIPLALGAGILVIMLTWRDGRALLADRIRERAMTFEDLEALIAQSPPSRIRGGAIYLTGSPDGMPPALWRILRHLKVLHETVVLLRVVFLRVPHALESERITMEMGPLEGLQRVTVRYGFMEEPDIPAIIDRAVARGLPVSPPDVIYVLGRETLLATERPGLAIWREKLFAFLSRNATRATEFYKLPAERVLEVGAQIEL